MLFYYEPENPTINYLFRPVWEKLIAEGHHINIITPNPTRGISNEVQEAYKSRTKEEQGSITIYRVKAYTYAPAKFSKGKLLRRYISVSMALTRKLKKIKSDIVFVSSNPPLLYSYLVTKYCARKKIPVIYNVQDIYPDNIFSAKSMAYKVFDVLQKKSLKHASEVVTISETMRHTLLKKGDYNDKISVIYNFDISSVYSVSEQTSDYFDHKLFNVVYAGNIGYVQDLDVILAAAKLLLHDLKIAFHIFGEGSQAKRISNRIRNESIVNTTYYPALSVEDSALIYKHADVNLISILPGIIKTALPLKTASALATGKPIIFIGLDPSHHKEEWTQKAVNLYPINDRNYEKVAATIKELAKDKGKNSQSPTPFKPFVREQNINEYVALFLKYLPKAK